ncbi:unnamed protein product [Tenebrio molitor]|jgi:threonine dehydrogenase-like Zn-dependent dehydrogenase|nr:unnamed protein product [Tenebrio molitor]
MESNPDKDCLPCKITSICCLMSIGSYLIYHGRQPQKYKYYLIVLGLGSIGLGIGEIFDKSPFRSRKQTN